MILAEIRVFGRAFAVQQRILGALFMREFMTRWGRRNLGFAWLFAEPLVFAMPVIAMWSMIRAPLDIFIGRQGLELIGNISACAVSFLLLYMLGLIDWPYDYALFLTGFLYM